MCARLGIDAHELMCNVPLILVDRKHTYAIWRRVIFLVRYTDDTGLLFSKVGCRLVAANVEHVFTRLGIQ